MFSFLERLKAQIVLRIFLLFLIVSVYKNGLNLIANYNLSVRLIDITIIVTQSYFFSFTAVPA